MGKRQDFIDLYRSGKGTRQKYIDLSGNYFRRKSMQGVHDPFKPLTILDMLKSGAFSRDLKHGGIASLAHGGRIRFAEGEDWKSKIGSFFSNLGWSGMGEDFRRQKEKFKARNLTEGDEHLRYFKAMGLPHSDNFLKDLAESWALANTTRDKEEIWNKYKRWLEMENLERANIAKGGLAGILNL
jgi:hypothetical protein